MSIVRWTRRSLPPFVTECSRWLSNTYALPGCMCSWCNLPVLCINLLSKKITRHLHTNARKHPKTLIKQLGIYIREQKHATKRSQDNLAMTLEWKHAQEITCRLHSNVNNLKSIKRERAITLERKKRSKTRKQTLSNYTQTQTTLSKSLSNYTRRRPKKRQECNIYIYIYMYIYRNQTVVPAANPVNPPGSSQLASKPANPPSCTPASQPASQPTSQPTSQPAWAICSSLAKNWISMPRRPDERPRKWPSPTSCFATSQTKYVMTFRPYELAPLTMSQVLVE